jgi:quercetin dioxygenase-like cupin family protein
MRRLFIIPVVIALIGLTLTGSQTPRAAAQDGTPITGIDLAPGVLAEVFAGIPSMRAPEQTLYLVRLTFQPGRDIFPHGHPGTTVFAVESGTFGWTLVQGTAHLVRGAAAGGTASEEVTDPGTEVILEPGDAIYYEDDVVHTARNVGAEPAVVLVGLLLGAGQPLLMPAGTPMAGMEMAATPTS